MTILIKPYLGCNLSCEYCYETQHRKETNPGMDYNLQTVLTAMEERYKEQGNKGSFGLHGGEPLCIPKQDVEAILSKAYELAGGCSIQTNATLIDDDHIAMFKKYNVGVGFSLDGPGELSKFRMSAKQAGKIMKLLYRLVEQENVRISVMCVISKSNVGTPELVSRLKAWLLELKQLKVGGRLNPCGESPSHQVDPETLADIYLDLAKFMMEHGMSWTPFEDMARRVRGEGAVCSFMGCDVLHTDSAMVILGDGSTTNCMRTNQGAIILRHPAKYNTRDEILQEIPQDNGGCRGCDFWYACHGGCPSMAIDDDWRNRTYMCPVHKKLFDFFTNVTKALKLPTGEKAYHQVWKDHPNHTNIGGGGHRDNHRDSSSRRETEVRQDRPGHTNIGGGGHRDNHRDFPPRRGGRRTC